MHAKLRCDETMNREDQRRRKMEKKEKRVGSCQEPSKPDSTKRCLSHTNGNLLRHRKAGVGGGRRLGSRVPSVSKL